MNMIGKVLRRSYFDSAHKPTLPSTSPEQTPARSGRVQRGDFVFAAALFDSPCSHHNTYPVELEMMFVDDLVEERLDAMKGKERRCVFDGVEAAVSSEGGCCLVPVTHKATLGY